MDANQAVESVEQVLLSRQLSPIEQFVLFESWMGKSYDDMARDTNYRIDYFREIGSRLWGSLSKAIGQKVTKKNIRLVLSLYLQKGSEEYNQEPKLDLAVTPESVANYQRNIVKSKIVASSLLEIPGRPVTIGDSLYIHRPPIEELVYEEISKPGSLIRIKAPMKMGRSSLIIRVMEAAKNYGYETVRLDFREADESLFFSLDKFLRWFCANITQQLYLNFKLNDYWDEDIGSKVSSKIYFQDYLLKQFKNPLVLVLSEVNRVFEHPHIAVDFLPMLRFWHEMARSEEVWQKLRLVIAHSTEIYVPLKLHQSPFNVGLAVKLPPFTPQQVLELAHRYQLESMSDRKIERLMWLLGGHPYLVNLAFYHLSQQNMTFDSLVETAPTLGGIYSDHLRGHLALLQQQSELIGALQQIWLAEAGTSIDAILAYKLESLGLIKLEANQATFACRLYHLYLQQQLSSYL